jgi:hypothetical protein
MERRTIKLDEFMLSELGRLASLEDAIGAQVDTGALNQLSMALTSLGHAARETLQEATARDVQRVIDTLERDGEVSQQDRELIRGWIVGDATTYLRVENDYKGWLFELRRLVGEIADARNGDLSLEQLQSLRGNIRDALRTAADIHFYREQAERVERFESAAKEWSANQKLILAGALRRMLVSSES